MKITSIQIDTANVNEAKDKYVVSFKKFNEETYAHYDGIAYVNFKDIEGLINILLLTATEEEQKQAIIENVLEEKQNDEKFIKDHARLFKRWKNNIKYKKDEIVNYYDKLFICVKEHISSYETIPLNDDGKTWIEYPKKQEKQLSEYDEHISTAKAWNRDESYNANVYVTWYRELYKSIARITDNEEPGKGSKWLKINKN